MGAPRVVVLDLGMGNLRSVAKAIERAGAEADVRQAVDEAADGLVVPGQGHFGACVSALGEQAGAVGDWIAGDRPYFGICLGMQVLFERSEEGNAAGLGLLAGEVRLLPPGLKIPHIGWNEVEPVAGASALAGVPAGERFYFVHSYVAVPAEESVVAATTAYGAPFCSAVQRGALVATQFHPEKSGDAGIALLTSFVERCAS